MSKFKRALLKGKAGNLAIRMIDSSRGTRWAGDNAMKTDPDFISHFTGIDPGRVLCITGTNGKSTMTNMIVHILRSAGYKVVSNTEGANLISGVAGALIKNSGMDGSIRGDYLIFETDERYLPKILDQLPCSNLLVTNLEKDQVQRNGDPDYVYQKIASAIDKHPMRLFLNGDEPRSCSLAARSDSVVFYSAARHERAFSKDDTFVTMPCPSCHRNIVFEYYNSDGMGKFSCPHCSYSNNNGRKAADYEAANVDFARKKFTVNGTEFTMPYGEPYMLYNYAAAAAVCRELAGISEEDSRAAIETFRIPEGRIDTITYRGCNIRYFRFKQENPETLQNFLNAAASDPDDKAIVAGFGTVSDYDPYYINTFYAYDCDYSALKDAGVKKYIFVTDTAAYDTANCFIYGGIDPELAVIIPTDDPAEIFRAIEESGCRNVYLSVKMHLFEEMKEYARGKESAEAK